MMYNNIFSEREFYLIAEPILRNIEFQRRRKFLHHNDSVYEHSLKVAFTTYQMAKFINKYIEVNIKDAVIGALLHDFYTRPWRENKNTIFWKKHGFAHANVAMMNSYEIFPSMMNIRIANTIKRHMFPLTLIPPMYIEGWIVSMADKYVSLEIFKKPKTIPRYIGMDLNRKVIATKCKNIYAMTQNFVSHMY